MSTARRPTETAASLYETDDHAWVLEQAALLRAGRAAELDAIKLAEELEDLVRPVRAASASRRSSTSFGSLTFNIAPSVAASYM